MEIITILDKKFEVFIDENEISNLISTVADEINNSNIENPLFIGIMNGSFLFCADLMRKITLKNSEISFVKLSSYIGTKTNGIVNEIIGRNVIVLEDIVDTGITLEKIITLLKKEDVNDIKIATLLFKPDSYKKDFKIDYIGKSIGDDFVVGYGLDYNELGRNLKHIYKLKN